MAETSDKVDPVAIYASYDCIPSFKRRLRKAGFKLTSRDGMGSYYNPLHWEYIGMGIPAVYDTNAMENDPEYIALKAQNEREGGDWYDLSWKDGHIKKRHELSPADPGDFWADNDAWRALTPEAKAWVKQQIEDDE